MKFNDQNEKKRTIVWYSPKTFTPKNYDMCFFVTIWWKLLATSFLQCPFIECMWIHLGHIHLLSEFPNFVSEI